VLDLGLFVLFGLATISTIIFLEIKSDTDTIQRSLKKIYWKRSYPFASSYQYVYNREKGRCQTPQQVESPDLSSQQHLEFFRRAFVLASHSCFEKMPFQSEELSYLDNVVYDQGPEATRLHTLDICFRPGFPHGTSKLWIMYLASSESRSDSV
jgi:hypothetical protein